jgi:hypothetical protein
MCLLLLLNLLINAQAWKLVDASTEREARARETIQQLKAEIQNLGKLVNEGAGLSIGQENTV